MASCLVQQLFRQKIGLELDQSIVDEVLFPMLFKPKHPSKELLLDIKLTQSCNEYGLSVIVICRVIDPYDEVPEERTPRNIYPFGPHRPDGIGDFHPDRAPGGRTLSQMRRLRHKSMWGSIDILNELRSLKHPQIRDHPPSNQDDQFDCPGAEFEDVYLSLQEQPLCPRGWPDRNFVNDYLEDALNNGKRISWGGDPSRINNNFDATLSTYYD